MANSSGRTSSGMDRNGELFPGDNTDQSPCKRPLSQLGSRFEFAHAGGPRRMIEFVR
jgi:hypothetical protein